MESNVVVGVPYYDTMGYRNAIVVEATGNLSTGLTSGRSFVDDGTFPTGGCDAS